MTRKLHPDEAAEWKAEMHGTEPVPVVSDKPVAIPSLRHEKKPKQAPPLSVLEWRDAERPFKPHPKIQATLDLHGMTQDEAFVALEEFFARQRARHARHLAIITGKGRQSEGVLRRQVPRWLNEPALRPLISVLAYAPENKGGEGVLHVLLRATRN